MTLIGHRGGESSPRIAAPRLGPVMKAVNWRDRSESLTFQRSHSSGLCKFASPDLPVADELETS